MTTVNNGGTIVPVVNVKPVTISVTSGVGAHDAYNKGDRVNFNYQDYESLMDGNTWSPSDYPAGWKTI